MVGPGSLEASLLFTVVVRKAKDTRDERITKDFTGVSKTLKKALDWLGAGAKTAVGYKRDEILKSKKALPDYLALLSALKADRWKGAEAQQVAQHIKILMEKQKCWKDSTQAKRPERDKDYQRMFEVKCYLERKP